MYIGSGFVTILIYGGGEEGAHAGDLLTEALEPILTESSDTILVEQV